MKVIISTLNSKYIHASLAPWCLFSAVKEYCQNTDANVIEGTINENLIEIKEKIIRNKPDLIGFCCYIWNITKTLELISLIKEVSPKTIIVVGGPEVSYNPETVLKNQNIDYLISGEGEIPFSELINCLENDKKPENINGLCFRNGSKIIVNSTYTKTDLSLPNPYTEEFYSNLNGRIAYIETSRGCPYSCAFCLSGRCGNVKYLDLEEAKKRILKLANSGTETVKFVDRTFNANKKRAYEIISFIIENYNKTIPENVCFHFEIAGDILDEKTIALLGTAPVGLFQLEIGLQSFNEETLKYINRKTDTKILINNIKKLLSFKNMHIHIDLIAGLPKENFESFRNSFNTAYSLKPNMLQLGFLKLLHGAPMREFSEQFPCKYDIAPPYEVIETPYISENELLNLKQIEDSLERIYNSGRFINTAEYLVSFFDTAFDFYAAFSAFATKKVKVGITLNDYAKIIYDFGSTINNLDINRLRDLIVLDLLSSVKNCVLPSFLKKPDARLKSVVKFATLQTPKLNNIKRSVAILDSFEKAIFVDYVNQNPVTKKFEVHTVNLSQM